MYVLFEVVLIKSRNLHVVKIFSFFLCSLAKKQSKTSDIHVRTWYMTYGNVFCYTYRIISSSGERDNIRIDQII